MEHLHYQMIELVISSQENTTPTLEKAHKEKRQ
jgi:hypothetical protein